MLIIWKFSKRIAVSKKRPRRPRVWVPCVRIWFYGRSKLRKMYWELRFPESTKKKLCDTDRLRAVGYVGGKYLVSVDANIYVFALFFMDIIACANGGYLWVTVSNCLQEDLTQWCSQTFWSGWSKTGTPHFAHEFKKTFISDVIFLQWPTCQLGHAPVLQYSLLFCIVFYSSSKGGVLKLYEISLFNLSVLGFSCQSCSSKSFSHFWNKGVYTYR